MTLKSASNNLNLRQLSAPAQLVCCLDQVSSGFHEINSLVHWPRRCNSCRFRMLCDEAKEKAFHLLLKVSPQMHQEELGNNFQYF